MEGIIALVAVVAIFWAFGPAARASMRAAQGRSFPPQQPIKPYLKSFRDMFP